MKPNESLDRQKALLRRLSCLPRKLLHIQGHDNATEFILHELCHQDCFNIDRAAYFIDNPDFDCLKGVAGHCRNYSQTLEGDLWKDPHDFSQHMTRSPFNQQVRSLMQESAFKRKQNEQDLAHCLAKQLEFHKPSFYAWPMKHDNHGIFIYERAQEGGSSDVDEILPDGVCLLSFCPVY